MGAGSLPEVTTGPFGFATCGPRLSSTWRGTTRGANSHLKRSRSTTCRNHRTQAVTVALVGGVGPRAAASDAGRSAQAPLLRRPSPPSRAGPARPALPPALRRPVGLRGLRPAAKARLRPHHAARPLQDATVGAPATSRQQGLACTKPKTPNPQSEAG